MNSDSEHPSKKQSTVRSLKRLDGICDLFEKRLILGENPEPAEFLQDASAAERLILLRELLALELEYHIKRGDAPDRESYLERYPNENSVVHQVFAQVGTGDTMTHVRDSQFDSGVRDGTDAGCPAEIGKYRIIGRLDAGGESDVYRGVHPLLTKELVIKLSCDEIDAAGQSRLIEEAKILAELEHPNIGRIYDLDIWDNRPFMVMEYIRGLTLGDYHRIHDVTPEVAARIIVKVARAVASAHRQGVVHRDIKPANIVMDESATPKLIDFGLARISDLWHARNKRLGFVSGSVGFMAPEQAEGKGYEIDARTDVFSLGGVLYFLITGCAPVETDELEEGLEEARQCKIDFKTLRSNAPERISKIAEKALSKLPGDRYRNADEFADELEMCTAPASYVPRMAVAAICLIGMLMVFGWLLRNGSTPDKNTLLQETASLSTKNDGAGQLSENGSWTVLKQLTQVNAPFRVANFHPEGKFVVVGNAAQQGSCWALPHGVFRYATRRPVSEIDGMVYNNAGNRLAVVVRRHFTVELWDSLSGQVVQTFKGHTDETESVAFSADEIELYSVAYDGKLKMWDIESGDLLREIELGSRLYSIAVKPDGKGLFVAADNGLIYHVNLVTDEVNTLQGHTGTVRHLAISANANRMVSTGEDSLIVVWNTEKPEIVTTLKGPDQYQSPDSIYNAVLSPDGKTVVAGTNKGMALVIDVESGQMIDRLGAGEGRCVVGIDHTGRQLVTAAEKERVKIWAVTPGS